MTQSNTNALADEKPRAFRLRNPLNPPIRFVAYRVGGTKAKEVERFLRFAVVGATGAVIDLGLVYLLQATIIPPVNDLSVALVTGVAFFTAVISNFIWTSTWVYPESRTRARHHQLAMFAFISVVGGVGRTLWVTLMHDPVGQLTLPLALPFIELIRPGYVPGPLAASKFGTLASQIIAMVVVMFWNFFANRRWTYGDVE